MTSSSWTNVVAVVMMDVEPFSRAEIDVVIKELPVDRAPGPDRFNGLFSKKCWNIIQSDFMCLVSQFGSGPWNLSVLMNPSLLLFSRYFFMSALMISDTFL